MKADRKSIAKNTIYSLIKTFSSIIFPVITFPYVNRVLLPDYVGKYNFSFTYVSYYLLLASLGITTYAVRECSLAKNDKDKLTNISSQIFSINICSMLVAYVLLFGSLILFRKLDEYRLAIIILSSMILFSIIGTDWLNSAFEDFKYITIRTVLFQLLSLIALFVFVRQPEDYLIYAIITAVAAGGANVLNVFYRRKFCRIKIIFNIKSMGWKRHFPPIVLLFSMLLVQTIFTNSDITMLGIMKSDYDVGVYSAAVKIYNLLNQIIGSFFLVTMPRLTECFAENNFSEINRLLNQCLQYIFGLGLPCIIGTVMLSDEIILLVGGEDYSEASVYLIILMIGLFFSMIGGSIIGNIILLPSKKEKIFLKACIAAALVNVCLNLIFIPMYGALAAAISTVISHIVVFVMLIRHIDKRINFGSFSKIIIAPSLGCGCIVIICLVIKFLINNTLLVFITSVAISVLVYGLILLLLKYQLLLRYVNQFLNKIKR